jgi:hypothetical protein
MRGVVSVPVSPVVSGSFEATSLAGLKRDVLAGQRVGPPSFANPDSRRRIRLLFHVARPTPRRGEGRIPVGGRGLALASMVKPEVDFEVWYPSLAPDLGDA